MFEQQTIFYPSIYHTYHLPNNYTVLSKYHLTQSEVDELIECNYSAIVMRIGAGGEAFSLANRVLLPALPDIF